MVSGLNVDALMISRIHVKFGINFYKSDRIPKSDMKNHEQTELIARIISFSNYLKNSEFNSINFGFNKEELVSVCLRNAFGYDWIEKVIREFHI